jgi:hypothetical protein
MENKLLELVSVDDDLDGLDFGNSLDGFEDLEFIEKIGEDDSDTDTESLDEMFPEEPTLLSRIHLPFLNRLVREYDPESNGSYCNFSRFECYRRLRMSVPLKVQEQMIIDQQTEIDKYDYDCILSHLYVPALREIARMYKIQRPSNKKRRECIEYILKQNVPLNVLMEHWYNQKGTEFPRERLIARN